MDCTGRCSFGVPVLPIFIFDAEILRELPEVDPRVSFIYQQLDTMCKFLQKDKKTTIATYFGKPIEIFNQITTQYEVRAVFANKDYEPYALERDQMIADFLENQEHLSPSLQRPGNIRAGGGYKGRWRPLCGLYSIQEQMEISL